jgi:hypothetical protein
MPRVSMIFSTCYQGSLQSYVRHWKLIERGNGVLAFCKPNYERSSQRNLNKPCSAAVLGRAMRGLHGREKTPIVHLNRISLDCSSQATAWLLCCVWGLASAPSSSPRKSSLLAADHSALCCYSLVLDFLPCLYFSGIIVPTTPSK